MLVLVRGEESIVDSPHIPGVVRPLVVRSGDRRLGEWLVERRNMREGFIDAFGREPEEELYTVALSADNDQTGQSVVDPARDLSVVQ